MMQEGNFHSARADSDPGQPSSFRSNQLKFERLGHLETKHKLADAQYQLASAERSRLQLEARVAQIEQQLEQCAVPADTAEAHIQAAADAAVLQEKLSAALEGVKSRDAELAVASAELRAVPFQLGRYQAIIKRQDRKVVFLQKQLSDAQQQVQAFTAQQQHQQQVYMPRHSHVQPKHQQPPAAAIPACKPQQVQEDPNWCLLEAAAAWLEAHRLKKKLVMSRDELAAVQEQLLGWQCADILLQLADVHHAPRLDAQVVECAVVCQEHSRVARHPGSAVGGAGAVQGCCTTDTASEACVGLVLQSTDGDLFVDSKDCKPSADEQASSSSTAVQCSSTTHFGVSSSGAAPEPMQPTELIEPTHGSVNSCIAAASTLNTASAPDPGLWKALRPLSYAYNSLWSLGRQVEPRQQVQEQQVAPPPQVTASKAAAARVVVDSHASDESCVGADATIIPKPTSELVCKSSLISAVQ